MLEEAHLQQQLQPEHHPPELIEHVEAHRQEEVHLQQQLQPEHHPPELIEHAEGQLQQLGSSQHERHIQEGSFLQDEDIRIRSSSPDAGGDAATESGPPGLENHELTESGFEIEKSRLADAAERRAMLEAARRQRDWALAAAGRLPGIEGGAPSVATAFAEDSEDVKLPLTPVDFRDHIIRAKSRRFSYRHPEVGAGNAGLPSDGFGSGALDYLRPPEGFGGDRSTGSVHLDSELNYAHEQMREREERWRQHGGGNPATDVRDDHAVTVEGEDDITEQEEEQLRAEIRELQVLVVNMKEQLENQKKTLHIYLGSAARLAPKIMENDKRVSEKIFKLTRLVQQRRERWGSDDWQLPYVGLSAFVLLQVMFYALRLACRRSSSSLPS